MKRVAIIIGIIAILTGIEVSNAQTLLEAARYSRQTNNGSARATAMGGAFTALGGEPTSLSKNPAGVGVFRNTELSITLAPTIGKTTSTTELGDANSAKRNSFQMDNLGFVMAFPTYGNSALKYFNIGVNYTNVNNFNNEAKRIVGTSPTSMTHVWAAQSNGIAPENLDNLSTELAYNTYLINPDGAGGYFSVLDYASNGENITDPVSQTEKVREKGYQADYNVSFGANIDDKWYVGLGISAQQVSYRHTSLYREAAPLDAPSGLDYYDYYTWEHNDAVGANFSLGVIYRPTNMLRLGASIHTPTWYEVSYDAEADIQAYYNSMNDPSLGREDNWFSDHSLLTSYHYKMRTAWRANLGAAFVFGQFLIVSADAEYVAYSKAKYSEPGDDFYNFEPLYKEMNQQIRSIYTSRWNYALGVEFKLNPNLSLRYGYNLNKSPYRNAEESDLKQHNCGIGWTKNWAVVDLSYSNYKYGNTTQFYNWGDYAAIPVNNNYRRDIIKITLGAKF